MDALSSAESREVEALAAQYPEIQRAIESIQEAVNSYALLHEETPRPELKQEILGKVQSKTAINSTAVTAPSRNWLGLVGLSVGLVSLILMGICFSRSQRLEKNLEQVVAEREILQNNYNRLVANFEFINNPATKIVPLAAPAGSTVAPDAQVLIYWNSQENATLLAIKNLPKPPTGKQYQLWSIKGNNAPVPAGLIDFNALDFQQMERVATVDAFAITLENEGGSATPTMPIYVVGTI